MPYEVSLDVVFSHINTFSRGVPNGAKYMNFVVELVDSKLAVHRGRGLPKKVYRRGKKKEMAVLIAEDRDVPGATYAILNDVIFYILAEYQNLDCVFKRGGSV